MSSDSKTKIRPQQSCLRCRERKVKCDRSIPCHACIIRGLEAECTYLTTAEDRAHISQSEIINQLRREVAQLRGHLNQSPRETGHSQSQSHGQRSRSRPDGAGGVSGNGQRGTQYAPAHTGTGYNYNGHSNANGFGYATSAGAGSASTRGTPDTGEGSWRGSSPSSSITTMTNSVTVTSPDSTGSENGAGSMSASSRSASASVSAYPIATGYAPQIAELDGSTAVGSHAFRNPLEDATMPGYYTGGMTFSPGDMSGTLPIQMQGLPVHGLHAQDAMLGMHHPALYRTNGDNYMLDGGKALPYLQHTGYPTPTLTSTVSHYGEEYPIPNEDDRPHAYHQWEQDAYGNPNPSPNQFPNTHIHQTPSHYSTINTFTNITATNINTYTDAPFSLPTQTSVSGDTSSHASPSSQDRPSPTTIMNSMPSSWKGEGKQELLEILLETIASCDEQRLPQVIEVLRASPSPEEAVSGLCQVLGIWNDR
ncbi:hypothetical protein N7463_009214 [Penicillium fimorum]|uniref:Zn(2)-C6 fungal-type domain-containing protein n=1 Tax=Penicillium fimorum TaxID=1882269 RepID=A0A9X0C402_9EURO|nr:hypothetical protein N7463_009214 [Penicillium fimorum]